MKLQVSRRRLTFRVRWRDLAIGTAALPFAVLFVAWLGLFNVGAASGHRGVTEWFLHFTMRASVRTYALFVEEPAHHDESLVLPAAGHFATGCAVCHGAPGEPRPAMAKDMLPEPPRLLHTIHEWNDAELFRIVKHGIRYTGMPAWPSQKRDDEVWGMVAFLRQLPELEPQEYRELAYGPAASGEPASSSAHFEAALAGCARCHGVDGLGRSEAVPVIAGQRPAYLEASLHAYADGDRESGTMEQAATEADAALWDRLVEHFAAQPAAEPAMEEADAELVERGRAIARRGIPDRDIPACLGCHDRPDRNPVYPNLNGQKRPYLENQLRLFAEGRRGGTRYAHLMTKFASRLKPEERKGLAAYFASRTRQGGAE